METKENLGRLVGIIYRHTRMYYNHELGKLGLGSGDHIFILKLSEKEGITQNEITGRLHFDKAHTARTIVKLMEQGYVIKKIDENDKRAYRLFLTQKGKEIIPQIKKIMKNWTETLMADLGERDRDKLYKMLLKISDVAVTSVRCCSEINNT